MTLMPSWRMPGSDGRTWTSAELKGSTYVMYFYPKDQTPGCTIQACDFRDHMGRLQAAGIKVFGVSPDSLASHHKFSAKEKLNFPLLTDNDHSLATKLGVWAEKSLYGRTFPGIERTTFLVGPDGVIIGEWRKVKVAGHVTEVVNAATGVTVPPKPVPIEAPAAPAGAPVAGKPVVAAPVVAKPAAAVKAPVKASATASTPAKASAPLKPATAKAAPAKAVAKVKAAVKSAVKAVAKSAPVVKAKAAAKTKLAGKDKAPAKGPVKAKAKR